MPRIGRADEVRAAPLRPVRLGVPDPVLERGADYTLALKENQAKLHAAESFNGRAHTR